MSRFCASRTELVATARIWAGAVTPYSSMTRRKPFRMSTQVWMLSWLMRPCVKVSRPSGTGFWSRSSVRSAPSGATSAISMRTEVEPMSMTASVRPRAGDAGAAGFGVGSMLTPSGRPRRPPGRPRP